jgi:hypothetical protein
LHEIITLALKLKENFEMAPSMANLMEDDMVVALDCLCLLSTLENK